MRWWLSLCLVVLGCSGCFIERRVSERISRRVTGPVGWFQLANRFELDAKGNAVIPPPPEGGPGDDEQVEYDENETIETRLKARLEHSMTPMLIDDDSPCPSITGALHGPPPGPVYLLVHGIYGAREEWAPVLPLLERTHPAGMFMFRWNATQVRSTILDALAPGVNRIVRCYPHHAVTVIAHSAGGVLMSFEASRLNVNEPVTVLTVASPLAGVGYHAGADEDDDNTRFLNDLGSIRHQYSAAAPNVTVIHLRTSYPGDRVMKPNAYGRAPNQRGVKVENAREVDLPEDLSHDGSLVYVARQLAAGKHF